MNNWFDTMAHNFEAFWNMPIPILGFSFGVLIVGALAILSKTSIGTRSLQLLKALFEDLKWKINNALEEFKKFKEEKETQIKEIADKYEIKVHEMESYYENKLAIAENHIAKVESLLLEVAENSHNIKVKEALSNYCVSDKITEVNDLIKAKVEEVKISYEDRIAALEAKLNEIDSKTKE